jgi:hypothetical protein
MTAKRTAWLLLFAVLAACVPTEEPKPVAAPPPEPEVAEPAPPEPELPPPPEAPAPKPDGLAALPPTDPEVLLNLDTAEMADLLGTPARIEDQPPALIWIYEAENLCTLRLFFYPELDGGRFLSLTYEIEPSGDKAAERTCVDTLRRAHVG